jgi:hypothetical protein
MKTTIGAAAAIACMLLLTPVTAPPTNAAVDVSFDMFYSNLSPHGSWLVSGSYGRVYQRGWNPYYDGHWQYADVGWVWVSDYDWGSIPYHYGTWVDDPEFGWVWVPGYTWAPAWVVFRTGPSAVGWAPVAPGFSLSVSLGGGGYYEPPASAFIFVSTREFAAPRIRPYVISPQRTNVYIQNTTVVRNLTVQNNIVVNRGPDVRVIEQASGRQLRPEPVERVQHVAPFAGFNRQQMAVRQEPGRAIRAAEPVPERTPLPDSGSRANNQVPQQPQRGFPQHQQQPQQQQERQQQQREQQSPRPQQDRQVLPQPIPPDEPRPLQHPRPAPPRPPVPQPSPRMEPDHSTPHATPPQQQHGDQHQQQPQPQQQQQQQKNSNSNKKKPKEPPPHPDQQKDQQGGGVS